MVSVGRIVHFVTKEGKHRPAIVVEVWSKESGCSNLQVFTDGYNDSKSETRNEFDQVQNVAWKTSINFSEEPKPYTWHWPERED